MTRQPPFYLPKQRTPHTACTRCGKIATDAAWRKSACRRLRCRKPTYKYIKPKPTPADAH